MLKLYNYSKLFTSFTKKIITQSYVTPIQPSIVFNISRFVGTNQLQKSEDTSKLCKEVLSNVNNCLETSSEGRLFAVVQICGKQFKITAGDIVIIEGFWPPNIGDKIKLEKVLAVGGNLFSIIGRPLVDLNLVNIEATIVEKTLSHTRTHFKKKRRKQYMRINFFRNENTMIMINSIDLNKKL